jgi:hypothetical protein
MQKLEAQLTAAKVRSDLLHQHLRAAQIAHDAAADARQAHLIDGDLSDAKTSTALQARVSVTESALAGIEAALAIIETSITDIQEQLNAERDAIARKVASDALAADTAAVETMLGSWLTLTRNLAVGFSKLNLFEASSISNCLINAAGEFELAGGLVLPDATRSAAAILTGQAPIPAAPAAVIARIEEPPPPVTRVFAIKNVKWTNAAGFQQFSAAYFDADLPSLVAAQAISAGHAVAMDHPTRREMHGSRSIRHPNPQSCINLDADESATLPQPDAAIRTDAPIQHEQFRQIDRGPPRELRIAGNHRSFDK